MGRTLRVSSDVVGASRTYGSDSTLVRSNAGSSFSSTKARSSSPRSRSVEQRLVVRRFDEAHLDTRPPLDIPLHRPGQEPDSGALEGADAQRARLALGEGMKIGFGGTHRGGGPPGVPQQPLPRLRGRHRPAPAGTLEQGQPGRALERGDLLADRGLRVAELDPGPPERPRLDDGFECGQMADLDSRQSIMFLDRFVHLFAFYESIGCDDAVGMKRFDLELRVLLALAFVNGLSDSSLVPLLPSIRDGPRLSPVQAGMLFTTTTLAMLVAALPVGYAANRFGTRRLLLLAAALMPIALTGQAVAGSLPAILGARLVFGLSFGILWVVGPARAASSGRAPPAPGR